MKFLLILALLPLFALSAPTSHIVPTSQKAPAKAAPKKSATTPAPTTVPEATAPDAAEAPVTKEAAPAETEATKPSEPASTAPAQPAENPESHGPAEKTHETNTEASAETEHSTPHAPAQPAEVPEATQATEASPVTETETLAPFVADSEKTIAKTEEAPGTEGDASTSSESGEKGPKTPSDSSSSSGESDEDIKAEEPKFPVVAKLIATGAEATVDGVTVRFALQATWMAPAGKRRAYLVKITNNSGKDVCEVTFSNNVLATNIWNLAVSEDGLTLSTKGRRIAHGGGPAGGFGYVSSVRSRPTILDITYC